MALYNISSPSGKEGKIAGFIIGELRRMGIPFRQDRYGNIYAVKGQPGKLPLCRGAHGRGTPAQDRLLCGPSCGGLYDCGL